MTANTTDEENVTDRTKIQSITLKNFKAFSDKQTIEFGGKNVLIYGENGSGKSSLARALEVVVLAYSATRKTQRTYSELVIMVNEGESSSGYEGDNSSGLAKIREEEFIEIIEKYKRVGSEHYDECFVEIKLPQDTTYRVSTNSGNYSFPPKNMIHITYLSYRELSDIHISSLQKSLRNIFDENNNDYFRLILNMILPPFEGDPCHKTWLEGRARAPYNLLISNIFNTIHQDIPVDIKKLEELVDYFNLCLSRYKNSIVENYEDMSASFGLNSRITHFQFHKKDYTDKRMSDTTIELQLLFDYDNMSLGESIVEILNEARLSAISLSFYFAILKAKMTHDTKQHDLNILILDDALTGLDMSNRLPVVKILKEHFTDYQIFFLTHDKVFYEKIGDSYLDDWKKIEMYQKKGKDQFPSPVIYSQLNHVEKANFHLEHHRYDVAGNFLRKEAERIVKELLPEEEEDGKLSLENNIGKLKDYYSRAYVDKKEYQAVISDLNSHKIITLNPASHHNWATQFYEYEVREAFKVLEELSKLPKVRTVEVYALSIYSPSFLLVKNRKDENMELSYKYPPNSEEPSYEATFSLQKNIIGEYKFKCTDSENGYRIEVIDDITVSALLIAYKHNEQNHDDTLEVKQIYSTVPEKTGDSDRMVDYFKKHSMGAIDNNWWHELSWVEGKITKTIGKTIETFKQHKQQWLGALEKCLKQPKSITILREESLSYKSPNDLESSIEIKLTAGIKLLASLSVEVQQEEINIMYKFDSTSCEVSIISILGQLKNDEISDKQSETPSSSDQQIDKKQSKKILKKGQNSKLSDVVEEIETKLGVTVDWQKEFKTPKGKSLEDLKNEILKK